MMSQTKNAIWLREWKVKNPNWVMEYNKKRREQYRSKQEDKKCELCGIILKYDSYQAKKHCRDCIDRNIKEILRVKMQKWREQNRDKDRQNARNYRLRQKHARIPRTTNRPLSLAV